MNIKELCTKIDSIPSGKCVRFVMDNEVETLEKSRLVVDKTGKIVVAKGILTPENLSGARKITDAVVNIGNAYTKAVKRQIEKAGGNPDSWVTAEHKWAEVDPRFSSGNIYRKQNDHESLYLRYYTRMSNKYIKVTPYDPTTYEILTMSWEQACAWLKKDPKKSGSEKQERAGVKKQVEFRLVKLENIRYIRSKDIVYDSLTDNERELLLKVRGAK